MLFETATFVGSGSIASAVPAGSADTPAVTTVVYTPASPVRSSLHATRYFPPSPARTGLESVDPACFAITSGVGSGTPAAVTRAPKIASVAALHATR